MFISLLAVNITWYPGHHIFHRHEIRHVSSLLKQGQLWQTWAMWVQGCVLGGDRREKVSGRFGLLNRIVMFELTISLPKSSHVTLISLSVFSIAAYLTFDWLQNIVRSWELKAKGGLPLIVKSLCAYFFCNGKFSMAFHSLLGQDPLPLNLSSSLSGWWEKM